MVDPVTSRLWGYRLLFVVLVMLLVIGRMLPVGQDPGSLPGPDVILALTFAWVMRRPAYVPAPLIVALFVPVDLLLQQPPGLGALTTLLGAEFLRSRRGPSRDLPFLAEWAMVAAVLLGVAGTTQAILVILVTEAPPLGLQLVRALFTAAAYPLVVAFSAYLLNIRRPSPGEVDALGDRL